MSGNRPNSVPRLANPAVSIHRLQRRVIHSVNDVCVRQQTERCMGWYGGESGQAKHATIGPTLVGLNRRAQRPIFQRSL